VTLLAQAIPHLVLARSPQGLQFMIKDNSTTLIWSTAVGAVIGGGAVLAVAWLQSRFQRRQSARERQYATLCELQEAAFDLAKKNGLIVGEKLRAAREHAGTGKRAPGLGRRHRTLLADPVTAGDPQPIGDEHLAEMRVVMLAHRTADQKVRSLALELKNRAFSMTGMEAGEANRVLGELIRAHSELQDAIGEALKPFL
jgi:hypothetical protein